MHTQERTELQRKACEQYAAIRGWKVRATYIDDVPPKEYIRPRVMMQRAVDELQPGEKFIVYFIYQLGGPVCNHTDLHSRIIKKGGEFISILDTFRARDSERYCRPVHLYIHVDDFAIECGLTASKQYSEMIEYMKKHDMIHLDTFTDIFPYSDNRPKLDECISSIMREEMILVYSLRRVATTTKEACAISKRIQERKATMFFMLEECSTGSGFIVATMPLIAKEEMLRRIENNDTSDSIYNINMDLKHRDYMKKGYICLITNLDKPIYLLLVRSYKTITRYTRDLLDATVYISETTDPKETLSYITDDMMSMGFKFDEEYGHIIVSCPEDYTLEVIKAKISEYTENGCEEVPIDKLPQMEV